MRIIWSPFAVERVTEIATYIAQDNSTAARRWVENLFAKVRLLETSPHSGRVVPESRREDIRELLYGNYRVIYHLEGSRLAVLTVRHGKQLLPIEEIEV